MILLLVVCGGALILLYGVGFVRRRMSPSSGAADFQVPPGVSTPAPRHLRALLGERIQLGPQEFEVVRPGYLCPSRARLLFRQRPEISEASLRAALLGLRKDAIVAPIQNEVMPVWFTEVKQRISDNTGNALVQVSAAPLQVRADEHAELVVDPKACDPYSLEHGNALASIASACAWELQVYSTNGPLPARLSLELLGTVVRAVAQVSPPDVVYWDPAQKFIATGDLLEALAGDDRVRLVQMLTTLRQARVEGEGAPTILTDTVGMADFCLPDVQLHSRALEPYSAAMAVFCVAAWTWENDLKVHDGDTIQLPGGPLKLVRAHYAEPARPAQEGRIVLDLDPGESHAAGVRIAPFSGAVH
jgi:hypothetical protein